ncbi:MAG: hypothetical protein EBT83_07780 [Betaproteobacteria bacterium]|nr:hypothetical protein [Betaproteobacteria bacterium]
MFEIALSAAFVGGLAGAVFGVASTRIVMGSVPVMGRNHFFALFTVISSLGLGMAPMIWGAVLDALKAFEVTLNGWIIDRYAFYFAALLLFALLDLRLVRFLHEGAAVDPSATPPVEPRPVAPVE